MSIYTTQGTIRKMPLPSQTEAAAPEQDTFTVPGALHSCVGGVARSLVGFRSESVVREYRIEPERGPLEKGRG